MAIKDEIQLFDSRNCKLGEGVFWHPLRKELFWFDILNKRLLSKSEKYQKEWNFEQYVSAGGWISSTLILIAGEKGIYTFDLDKEILTEIFQLESDNQATRSNDGRIDPWGGFWISTMGKNAEKKLGAIYRLFNGQLKKIVSSFTIPNSICFSKNDSCVYFSDTAKKIIYRQKLNSDSGWPEEEYEIFCDLSVNNYSPDGAVTDSLGNLWCAIWGSSKLICLSTNGKILDEINLPVVQPTCVEFGGDDINTLFISSASQGIMKPIIDGQTLALSVENHGNKSIPFHLS